VKVPGNIAPHFVTSRSRCPRATSTSVPRGREHLTLAVEECSVMFVEPAATKHTGEAVTGMTRSIEQQLGVK
jgi:hypothetical protein